MSIEDLRSDLEANMEEAGKLLAAGALTTTEDLVKHLANTLWPFMANVATELEEMDGSVEELYTNTGDILQPDTAGRIAAVIVMATGLIMNSLKPRLDPKNPKDKQILDGIVTWAQLAKAAGEEIEQITVVVPEGEDEDEDPDEDDEDEDDEEDDDEEDDEDDDGDGDEAEEP